MTFLAFGAATLMVGFGAWLYFRRQEPGLPYFRAALHLGAYSAVSLAAVMAVYFIGDSAGLSEIAIAGLEVVLAVAMATFIFTTKGSQSGPVVRSRDHWLIAIAFIAVLWNLWFFSFWSVSIVADAAHSSFGRSAMIAAFNAGAGILGFPVGGWLADVAMRRGIGRKGLVVSFTVLQCLTTVAFGYVISGEQPSVWMMAALLFTASTFFNAMQPMAHAMLADITRARAPRLGVRHEQPRRRDRRGARAGGRRHAARRHRQLDGGGVSGRRADRRSPRCCSCSCASARSRTCCARCARGRPHRAGGRAARAGRRYSMTMPGATRVSTRRGPSARSASPSSASSASRLSARVAGTP